MVFLVIIGQKIFSDIKDIPERPVHPSYQVQAYLEIENLRNITHSPFSDKIEYHYEPVPITIEYMEPIEEIRHIGIFEFNDTDKKFDIDKKIKDIEPEINSIIALNKDISYFENEISSNKSQLDKLLAKYSVSLQEVIAGEQALMDKPSIKSSIISLDNEITSLNERLAGANKDRINKFLLIDPKLDILKIAYEQAEEYYENKIAFYNFIVFLLRLLFVLPLFIVSLYFYFKLKRKDSPHTIIATAITAATSLLFIQIMLMFLYEVLPIEWLARVFKILMEITILKYVIYYGSAFAVIAVFGSIVYFIQKKVFNPKIVAVRRIKDNKCPNCSFPLDLSYDFCPKCGRKLKEKCANCGRMRIRDLSHCPFCGKRI